MASVYTGHQRCRRGKAKYRVRPAIDYLLRSIAQTTVAINFLCQMSIISRQIRYKVEGTESRVFTEVDDSIFNPLHLDLLFNNINLLAYYSKFQSSLPKI